MLKQIIWKDCNKVKQVVQSLRTQDYGFTCVDISEEAEFHIFNRTLVVFFLWRKKLDSGQGPQPKIFKRQERFQSQICPIVLLF